MITSVFSSARKIAAEEDSLKGTGSIFHSLAPVNSMDRIPYWNVFFSFEEKITTGCQPSVESMDLGAWYKIFLEMNWS